MDSKLNIRQQAHHFIIRIKPLSLSVSDTSSPRILPEITLQTNLYPSC